VNGESLHTMLRPRTEQELVMCNRSSLACCPLSAFGSPLGYYSDPSAPSRTSFATISPLYSRVDPMRLPHPKRNRGQKTHVVKPRGDSDLRMKTYLEPAYVSSPLRVFRAEARGLAVGFVGGLHNQEGASRASLGGRSW
jgi:hypothetical protein